MAILWPARLASRTLIQTVGQRCRTFFFSFLARAALPPWPAMPGSVSGCDPMSEIILGGIVAGILLAYLLWALLRPEDL